MTFSALGSSLLHKQQQLNRWRGNHLGSSRTLRKTQGPDGAGLCCTAEGGSQGGRTAGRGRDRQQAGSEQHYLITTAASAKRQAAGARGVGQINLSAQAFFFLRLSAAGCRHFSPPCPNAGITANGVQDNRWRGTSEIMPCFELISCP